MHVVLSATAGLEDYLIERGQLGRTELDERASVSDLIAALDIPEEFSGFVCSVGGQIVALEARATRVLKDADKVLLIAPLSAG